MRGRGAFFVFDEGLEVQSGVVGVFGFVGAEAIERGLCGVADFFQGGFLVFGEARAVEGNDGLQAEGGFGLAGFAERWDGCRGLRKCCGCGWRCGANYGRGRARQKSSGCEFAAG